MYSIITVYLLLSQKFAEVGSLKEGTVHAELEQLVPVTGKKSDTERKRKAEIAAKRRARLMAQMSKMQRNFIAGNVELFESSSSSLRSAGSEMDLRWVEAVTTVFWLVKSGLCDV